MLDRRALKTAAKANLKKNYWPVVGAAFILTIVTVAGVSVSIGRDRDFDSEYVFHFTPEQLAVLIAAVGAIVALATTISIVLTILVKNPFRVGFAHFILTCDQENAAIKDMFASLKGNYVNYGVRMFTTDLVTALWALLLIVPGVIKSYAFRLVPYLLAENPGMSGKEARAMSSNLMNGHKWETFVLDLSFIGWALLAALTINIVGIFYFRPYLELTYGELYKTLSRSAAVEPAE